MRSLKRGSEIEVENEGENEVKSEVQASGNNDKNDKIGYAEKSSGNNSNNNSSSSSSTKDRDRDRADSSNEAAQQIEIQTLLQKHEKETTSLRLELLQANEKIKQISVNPTSYSQSTASQEQLRAAEIELMKLQIMEKFESQKQIDRDRERSLGERENKSDRENKSERDRDMDRERDKDQRAESEKKEYFDLNNLMRKRLKEEEDKVSQLSSENMLLQSQLSAPKTPQMAQFMVSE